MDWKDGTSFFLSNFRKERVRSSKQNLISPESCHRSPAVRDCRQDRKDGGV